ncbi:hypothetical protein JKP88DRAFT_354212 [Tribonema minus]|uniref:Uncharacterized protein n=1 Tax=Tribonema minus TaxID=303371 RepID=A0A835Z8I2_9STRA|nr:hypothetical protein JKP88DRAFT_354212 [Tribonema minus]
MLWRRALAVLVAILIAYPECDAKKSHRARHKAISNLRNSDQARKPPGSDSELADGGAAFSFGEEEEYDAFSDESDSFDMTATARQARVGRRKGGASGIRNVAHKLGQAKAKLQAQRAGAIQGTKRLLSEVRSAISSDMERTVSKATRPNDDPAKRKHVDFMLGCSKYFPAHMQSGVPAAQQTDRPLARETTQESWLYLSKTLAVVKRQPDPRRPSSSRKPFSLRAISSSVKDATYEPLVTAYAELASGTAAAAALDGDAGDSDGEGLASLTAKAGSDGLAVIDSNSALHNDVTVDALSLAATDLLQFWGTYQETLERMLQHYAQLNERGKEPLAGEVERLQQLCGFYLRNLPQVTQAAHMANTVMVQYGHEALPAMYKPLRSSLIQGLMPRDE